MNLDTQEIKEYYKYDAHGKRILFYVPNGACLWRAQNLNTKEPWTLDWINTFQPIKAAGMWVLVNICSPVDLTI